jgi:C6 transcription factor Pro1
VSCIVLNIFPSLAGLTSDAFNGPSRASTSLIARSYNVPENGWGTYDADPVIPEIPEIPEMTLIMPYYSTPQDHDSLAGFYTKNVLSLQYLLADEDIHRMMSSTADSGHRVVFTAVSILSGIYQNRIAGRGNDSVKPAYGQLASMFKEPTTFTVDHAIAALHTVSSFLFDGGRGRWEPWLRIACNFADGYLQQPAYSINDHIANFCDDRIGCFILRTAMWFDVIASVTLFCPPHFLSQYRKLFDPDQAFGNPWLFYEPRMSMLSVMGCENRVVWAMGEISNLACWKAEQERKGRLSMPVLVERGVDIERKLLNPMGPEAPCPRDELQLQQRLSADIFRASTRLYLHSVISGDFPYVPEIMKSVKEVVECLDHARQHFKRTSRSVVRSVVFSIFICGCLTDDLRVRKFLIDTLEEQANETVGNCSEVKRLMETVWANRGEMPNPSQPVPWREELKRSGLLLV